VAPAGTNIHRELEEIVVSTAPRLRVLAVINRPDLVTSIVRVMQFVEAAADDPRIELRTLARIPPWLSRLEQNWPRRKWLRWVVDLLQRAVMRRADRRILRQSAKADIVYTVTTPTAELNQRIQRQGAVLVMDIIDALWLPWFRRFGWQNLESMLAAADGVICENRFTHAYVSQHARRTQIVPDVPQLPAFDRQRDTVSRSSSEMTIGWIGGPDTVDALYIVYPVLERLFARHERLHFRILGAPIDRLPRFEKVRYSCLERYDQADMIREALRMHIGIFPQYDVAESRCRGTLKAKVYMAAGMATVCQDLGENRELVQHNVNGLLAGDAASWLEQLEFLLTHPDDRQRLAAAGLQTIRDQFRTDQGWARLRAALLEVYENRRAR
jgi:glycosyltransferase involved in cell wall biosynthesis